MTGARQDVNNIKNNYHLICVGHSFEYILQIVSLNLHSSPVR